MITTLFRSFFLTLLLSAPLLGQSPNEQARFLAGLPVHDGALAALARQPAAAEHAALLDKAWQRKERAALAPLASWARVYGSNFYGSGGPVFYMFSGPDVLYPLTLFPNATTYILCGTEPVGNAPDGLKIAPQNLGGALAGLRKSMNTMLNFNYFITKEMRTDLQGGSLGGTLPILEVFLARLGCTIEAVSFVNAPAPGVKIAFHGTGNGGARTLYYFKANLANGSAGGFLQWCAGQGRGMSLLKATSYLPQQESFSQVRRFLLDQSRVIVQDDSGIPLRDFPPQWKQRFFGKYTGPIEIFATHHQPDLAAAYAHDAAEAVPFAFGYHWQPARAALILATRP